MEMSLAPSPVLKYNKEWYEGLSDSQSLGTLLHELLHLLLLHALRRGDRDPLLWAVCCDIAANEHIPAEMLPPNAATTEKIAQKIHFKLERLKSAEYYYAILSKLLDDRFSFMQREDTVTLSCSNTVLFESRLQAEEDIPQVSEQALKSKMHEITDEAYQKGEVPEGLFGELDDTFYKRAQIDWKGMFKRFLTGRGRMQNRATYKRVSRRFDNYPGSKRSVGLRVLIALDESGSISNEQLQTFLHELAEVNRITNAQILVTEFDTECTKPKPAEEYRHIRQREKKGGTDFRPIFALADSLMISLVAIFTDGEGIAPDHADQRVLWVLTKDGKQPAPFGYITRFE
jgi:predicted metal-dependent peptidase